MNLGDSSDARDKGREHEAIAFIDLAWSQRVPGFHEFRSGCQQEYTRSFADLDAGVSCGSEQTDSGGGQALAGLADVNTFSHILAAQPYTFPGFDNVQNANLIGSLGFRARILLHDH